VYHVLNRANARMQIFGTPEDYEAFERILDEAVGRVKMRLLAYCVLPNHWHLVLWPRENGDLSAFVGWMTLTHTQRWHAHRQSVGSGHVYQGRFKSFLVESVIPGRVGRASLGRVSVRRAERPACRIVSPGRTVALVKYLAT